MILLCWHCGAELPVRFQGEWFSTSVQCAECGLVQADAPVTLAPSDEEVDYALDEWPPADRAAISATLVDGGVLYRWSDGIVLSVPELEEGRVDTILDELSTGDDDAPDDAAEEDELDEDADGGEAAHEAMQDLFVAADRLGRSPSDEGARAELSDALSLVATSLPPYGMESLVWRRIRELAEAAVAAANASAPHEAVVSAAQTLRDFLRQYV